MSVGKSPRGRYPIPDVVTPPFRICICLEWPDNPEHIAVLTGFIYDLTKRYNWGEPLTSDSEALAVLYTEIFDRFRESIEDLS